MTILYREWVVLNKATLVGHDLDIHDFNVASEWTTAHIPYCMIGERRNVGNDWDRWDSIFMPSELSFQLPSGMDEPCAFKVEIAVGLDVNDSVVTSFKLIDGIMEDPADPNEINWQRVSGRYYDGVNNYGIYPHNTRPKGSNYQTVTIADLPESYTLWFPPGAANTYRGDLFRNGYWINGSNYGPVGPSSWANNKICRLSLTPMLIHIQYINAVVNNIAPMYCPTAAGSTLVFTGMGFNNAIADIRGGWGGSTTCNDRLDYIYFDGLQSQGTYTYAYTAGVPVAGQFSIDSNEQATLVTQAMAKGTYKIRLYKQNVSFSGQARTFHITDYAGDWRCDADGRVYQEGEDGRGRFNLLVDDDYVPEGDFRSRAGTPMVLTKWTFKDKAGNEADKYYASIDTRSTERFYDGRIRGISSVARAIDDKTGAFNISDMTLELANNDKEFSKILASYSILKNQIVEVFHGWTHEPEGWKSSIIKMIVDDHSLKGTSFNVTLKDITQMYFKKKVPFYTYTSDEYANIHPDQEGRFMPEVLGNATLTTGEHKGAVEAVYVDTVNFEYGAARGSLKSVDQVYSNDTLMATPADYSIVYKDGGRTYIDFTGDQGDNKITYNAKGYTFIPWDDAGNGHVQNPSYIIAFFLSLIMEVPLAFLNMNAFDDLAAIYTAMGVDTVGKLIIQDEQDAEEVLKELLFSFGAAGFIDNTGRFKVERKDISNYSTSLFIFDQQDLKESAERQMNLNEAVNYVKPKWDYIPTHSIYKSATEENRQCAIDDFGAEMEPDTPFRFPWTDSATLVDQRILEELLKRGYGDQKISFPVPIYFIDELDVFTNFRFQDPFGLSSTGAGEVGRYYYVESLSYDFQNNKIDVVAIDLQWLLRQYCIAGDETVLASNWATAGEADRMYCYAGDEVTGKFPDGEMAKELADETAL